MGHEKHQYYFEKYLRNELSDADKKSFVEKLATDNDLRDSFNSYKKNRSSFRVNENEETRLKRRLTASMYLLISLTGIALFVNYYIDNPKMNNSSPSAELQVELKERMLWDKLPFFGTRQKNKANPLAITSDAEPIELEATDLNENRRASAISLSTGKKSEAVARIKADILIHDTFLAPIEKEIYELRFRVVKGRADSLNNDSITNLTYSRISQGKLHTDNPVLVEFWKSPVNYKGYSFNGKKLVLYGIPAPYAISLYLERQEISLKLKEGPSIKLIKDNEFHKL